ncbi:2-phospho-L-lactate guanylyltransferase [Microbulbifer agarilyticus]|uniref:2-phospho-L-lactate guanylyltransferase n=1 Tax=Microbulbifer agarilyticus TaxID=260552 RepID=UPI001CD667A4|nr:2-phospho-L-lactate guanylyltransferase [Microbulbifer agarilyticus]MCA0900569.1 2-phospho-L-lactate guanylyltransferase [Microbulbifer agarilyticus]
MWALLPLKKFNAAKQRLARILAPDERRGLFRAMVCDVLAVLQSHEEIDGVLVVGQDFAARDLANRFGADFLDESTLAAKGLNGAVHAGVQALALRGIEEVLVLHGDLPLITHPELSQLLDLHRQQNKFSVENSPELKQPRSVTIAPDKLALGTNCLICPTNADMTFFYGSNSFSAHTRSAFHAGLQLKAISLPGASSDIDTSEDLHALLRIAGPERAAHSFHYLCSAGIAARLRGSGAEIAANLDEQYYRVSG